MPMNSSSVPTFIIGSDGLFREGLRLILSKTPFRPLACVTELSGLPDVPGGSPILFVVGMTGQKHDSLCMKIRSRYPGSFIAVVGDQQVILETLAEGANGAFLSSITPKALLSSLHALVSGDLVIVDNRLWSSGILRRAEEASHPIRIPEQQQQSALIQIAARSEAEKEIHEPLSVREIAILERIVKGDSNKHVANFFKIAEATVKAHVKAIFRKIGATNRTQAAMWAVQNRVFDSMEESGVAAKV
jgi:two-component system, NarL family, nitrate/nitrite response regulator NarL